MFRHKIVPFMLVIAGFLSITANSNAITRNAASCTQAHVQAAITSAATGDIVAIPTCSGTDGTWTSGITVPETKKITIQGAGPTKTVITHAGTIRAISMGMSGGTITGTRITGIGFVQTSAAGEVSGSIYIHGKGWRVDHCKFTNTAAYSSISIMANGSDVMVRPYGVIDNNEFIQGRVMIGGMVTFAKNATFWASNQPLSQGGNDNVVFVEDNTFYKTWGPYAGATHTGNIIDTLQAGSYVARYNTITGHAQMMVHGYQSASERGGINWEIYGNSFQITEYLSEYEEAAKIRAGTGVFFGNYINSYYKYDVLFDVERVNATDHDLTPVGLCNGGSYADGNILSNGWPCRDQVGRGKDASAWTSYNNPAPTQEHKPAYLWLNRHVDSLPTINVGTPFAQHIVANRDYFTEVASFNGTSGVGCGTATPTMNCTVNALTRIGPGYYKLGAGESCSNITGYVGKNHTKWFTGTLYRCTATNTWTAYYTPYTYPHPLRKTTWGTTYIIETYDHSTSWALETGKTYTYSMTVKAAFIGKEVTKALQGSTLYSAVTSKDLVESKAGSYYYDTTAGKLYVRSTNNVNPNNYLITGYFQN